MNDLFNQLKDTSDQVDYTNNSLLQKSRLLKEQLLQSKITNTLNKNLIGRNYDQNMNVNAEELEIKNNLNPNLVSKNSNLPGTSDFIYFNNDNNFIENDMSYLAKTGMNIIELKGEGEMIPINDENKENKEKNNIRTRLLLEEQLNIEEDNDEQIYNISYREFCNIHTPTDEAYFV